MTIQAWQDLQTETSEVLPTFSRSRYSHHICINISRAKSINQRLCIRRFKMGVLDHVIEFINEAACNKDFNEDNRIGKRGAKIIA